MKSEVSSTPSLKGLLLNALCGFGAIFSKTPTLAVFFHRIALVDRRHLAKATKAEQGVYTALGVLMGLALLWTGIGMSTKIGGVLGAGPLMLAALFLFFSAWGWALEAVTVGTIGHGKSTFRGVALRVVVGLALVASQTLPLLTGTQSAKIDQHQHATTLSQLAASRGVTEKARDLGKVEAKAAELESELKSAVVAQSNPGKTAVVAEAEAKLAKARTDREQAFRQQEDARRTLASLKKKVDEPPKFSERWTANDQAKLPEAIANWQSRLNQRQAAFNQADAATQQAQISTAEAYAEQKRQLDASVSQARSALEQQAVVLKVTGEQVATDIAKSEELAKAANARNFLTDISALLVLARNDASVAITCLLVIGLAILLDLMPVAAKLALRDGYVGRAGAAQEESRIARIETDLRIESMQNENQLLERGNESAGLAAFVAQDNGALAAQRFSIIKSREVDSLMLEAEIKMMSDALSSLEQNLEKVQALSETAAKSDYLKPILRAELTRLQGRIDALAKAGRDTVAGAAAPAARMA